MQNNSVPHATLQRSTVSSFLTITVFTTLTVLAFFIFLPLVTPQNATSTILEVGLDIDPPVLIDNIPNQTWAKNTNLTNAFNIDDYFSDNSTLTYTATSVQNITVVINKTTNSTTNRSMSLISFIPDSNFTGIRNVTFTASDGFQNTSSNVVFLNVTDDTQPPLWSSPSRSASQIFQNDFVNFTASWTDNIQLDRYIFSINQGSGFANQTAQNFSGTAATSLERIQISASGGTTVFWKFFAYDTSGNLNVTTTQNFTVDTQPSQDSGDDSSSSSSIIKQITGIFPTTETEQITDFIVEPAESFIIETKQGATNTITLKITNIGNQDLSFTIDLQGLGQFTTTVSEPIFTLAQGESKNVVISITTPRLLTPDIYFGQIAVKTPTRTQDIPVIVKVQPFVSNLGVIVNISEEYKNIKPGEHVIANITLQNLADVEERKVTLYYAITDFFGKTTDAVQEEIVISQRTLVLQRNLTTTEETERGEYIFLARATSDNNVSIGSDTFEVGARFNLAAFIRTNIIIIFIIIFAIAIIMFLVRHKQNKEKLRLLNLYLMVSELKSLIKDNKTEDAVALYIRIKRKYGQPLSETALLNKEKLKEEMQKLAGKLDLIAEQAQATQKTGEEEKSDNKKDDGGEKEEDAEKSDTKESPKEDAKESAPKEGKKESDSKEEAKEPDAAPEESEEKPKEPTPKKEETVAEKPQPDSESKKPEAKTSAPTKSSEPKPESQPKEKVPEKETPAKPKPRPEPEKPSTKPAPTKSAEPKPSSSKPPEKKSASSPQAPPKKSEAPVTTKKEDQKNEKTT